MASDVNIAPPNKLWFSGHKLLQLGNRKVKKPYLLVFLIINKVAWLALIVFLYTH